MTFFLPFSRWRRPSSPSHNRPSSSSPRRSSPGRRRLSSLALALALTTTGAATTTSAAGDHSGTYVLLQQTTVVSEVPIVPDLVNWTRSVSIQRVNQEGNRLVGSGDLCSVEIRSNSDLVRTEMPPALERVMPSVPTNAVLEQQGGTLTFRQDPRAVVLGAKLEEPHSDPLPESAQDDRVYDQDRDGNPGVTVAVRGVVSGEVYVVQRSISGLRGAKRGNAFTGRVDFTTEDVVLGATSGLLKRRTNTRPDPSTSFFRMEKVSGDITCEQARKMARGWR